MADDVKVRVRRTPYWLGRYVVEVWEDPYLISDPRHLFCWNQRLRTFTLRGAERWRAFLNEETVVSTRVRPRRDIGLLAPLVLAWVLVVLFVASLVLRVCGAL